MIPFNTKDFIELKFIAIMYTINFLYFFFFQEKFSICSNIFPIELFSDMIWL